MTATTKTHFIIAQTCLCIGVHKSMKGQFTRFFLNFREIWKIPCVVQIFRVVPKSPMFPCLENVITKIWHISCFPCAVATLKFHILRFCFMAPSQKFVLAPDAVLRGNTVKKVLKMKMLEMCIKQECELSNFEYLCNQSKIDQTQI